MKKYDVMKADTVGRTWFSILMEDNLDIEAGDGLLKTGWFYPSDRGEVYFLKCDNEVVGAVGVNFRKFLYKGKVLIGAQQADMVVDKDHRTLRPVIKLQNTVREKILEYADFIYTFPNEKSQSVFKRVGFEEVCPVKRYAKLLRPYTYLADRCNLTGWRKMSLKIVCWPVDRLIAAKLKMSNTEFNNNNFDSGDLSDNANHIWKAFCEVSSKRSSYGLIGDHSTEYLQWRYMENPFNTYYYFAIYVDNIVKNYFIFYLQGDRVRVVDVGSSLALNFLMKSFESYCLNQAYSAIIFNPIGYNALEQSLNAFDYKEFESKFGVYMLFKDKSLGDDVMNSKNLGWQLGESDSHRR
jgi:hypothetical protein